MRFVYLHLAFFGFWIVANLGWAPGVPEWDPSFVVLAMIASVEAIFLSTFVLISQNRMAAAADKRADLDLQVSLLAEHEITKLATLVSGIADRLGVQTAADKELGGITQDVAPEAVLDELESIDHPPDRNGQATNGTGRPRIGLDRAGLARPTRCWSSSTPAEVGVRAGPGGRWLLPAAAKRVDVDGQHVDRGVVEAAAEGRHDAVARCWIWRAMAGFSPP